MFRSIRIPLIAISVALFLMSLPVSAVVSNTLAKQLSSWRADRMWDGGAQAVGVTHFGFTYRKSNNGGGPRMNDWCKELDHGKGHYWQKLNNDLNGNGQMDAGEGTVFNYWMWYQAKIRVSFEWERIFKSGAEWLQYESQGMKNAVPSGIGDGSMANATDCCAYKGPLRVHVTIEMGYDDGDRSLYRGDDPDFDAPWSAIVEGKSLAAKHSGFRAQRPSILIDLVRSIIADSPVGKGPARVTKKPATVKRPAIAKPKGTPGLTLTATPAELWADGKSTSKLKLVAHGPNGAPIRGAFSIRVANGKCSHIKFITDAQGIGSAVYTAPTSPGEDTISVNGADGSKTSLSIRLGGIKITPKDASQPALFADGKTTMEFVVICGSPSFKPLAGTKVRIAADESELPARGVLSAQSVTVGFDGKARFTYQAPDIYSTKTDLRRANAYVTAVANLGNPPKPIKSVYRIPIYTGQVYYLHVAKTGFEAVSKFKIPAPNRNGVLTGSVVCDAGKTRPVGYASLSLSDSKGKSLGKASTDDDGQFRLEFVGDKMSSAGQSVELSEPVKLEIDPDVSRLLKQWKADLEALKMSKYDVDSLKDFADDLPKNLAGSRAQCPDPMGSTEYLTYNAIRLAYMCKYIKLLDERQTESSEWFVDSMKNIISVMADFGAVSDTLEKAAKTKLKKKFSAKAWSNFEDSVLREFLNILYQQLQKGVDTAKTMGYETDSLDAFKKFGAEAAAKKGIDKLSEGLQAGFKSGVHKSSQQVLTQIGGRAVRGQLGSSAPSDATAQAKQLFTEYEKEHNQLNIAHLNRELYRLDAKFFTDTVIKGPFIYLKMKDLVMNPDIVANINELDTATIEKIQDEFIGGGDTVSKVFSACDAVFQGYQGYNWMVDFCKAGSVKQKLVTTLME